MLSRLAMIAVLALNFAAGNSQAIPLTKFTGTTYPTIERTIEGNNETLVIAGINFSVYRNDEKGTPVPWLLPQLVRESFLSGNGSPSLDTSAKYLYLYQGLSEGLTTLDEIKVPLLPTTDITSWGVFHAYGFDSQGQSSNPLYLLDEGAECALGSISGACTGAQPSFAADTLNGIGFLDPTSVSIDGPWLIAAVNLDPNSGSSIFGFTSNRAPHMTPMNISTFTPDTGLDNLGEGTVANAVPEPAMLALMGIGLAGLGFNRYRR